jgi:diadenosine tetraphosphate (Ap4A) HIT family hydrolase
MATNEKKHVNLDHARVEHQIAIMKNIIADDRCPFCKENLMEYHTKPIIHEDEHWILTENFAPYDGADKHYLLIAKKHCVGFWELSDEAKLAFFSIFETVREQDVIEGGTIVLRFGDTEYTAGTVTHLHAQLITGAPRRAGTEKILTALGYKMPHQ